MFADKESIRKFCDDYKKAAIRMSDIVVAAAGNVYTFKDFIDWGHLFADRIVYDAGINWAKKT